jgi:hypothetical protein
MITYEEPNKFKEITILSCKLYLVHRYQADNVLLMECKSRIHDEISGCQFNAHLTATVVLNKNCQIRMSFFYKRELKVIPYGIALSG